MESLMWTPRKNSPNGFENMIMILESPPRFKDRTREIDFSKMTLLPLLWKKLLLAHRYQDFSGSGAKLRGGKVFKAPPRSVMETGLY